MIFEFVWAWFDNLGPIFFLTAVVGGAAAIFGFAMQREDRSDKAQIETGQILVRYGVPAMLIGALLATVPGPESMWKVRVGLLKLELASPENVRAVGGHIEDIVKALECKHLGVNCPEKKESK